MQIKPEQLPIHLKRGLAPIYIVAANEPLQTFEATDLIRCSARAAGFTERVVLHVDARSDWSIIGQYSHSPSIFGEKRLLEIRLQGDGPGRQGSDALVSYAARPDTDQVMLFVSGQLDARQRKSKWYLAMEQVGVCVPIWPVDARNLPRWIQARVRRVGGTITGEAVQILAERMEGNLLACAQEIDKLALLCEGREIGAEEALQAAVNSAHFDAFALVDSTLAGDVVRTARIFSGLRAEGAEPVQILGTLVWEIREIARIANEMATRQTARIADLDQIITRQPALRRRKQLIVSALHRLDRNAWTGMLRVAGQVDQIIKGTRRGDPWEALLGLAMSIAGAEIPIPDAGVI